MTTLLKYWPIALFVINLVTVWFCWSLRQLAQTEVRALVDAAVKPVVTQTEALKLRVDDHHDRLTLQTSLIAEIRADIEGLPSKADLVRVEGEIKTVGAAVAAANAGIARIESFFIERGIGSK